MTSQISKALASAVSRRMTILVLLVVSLLSLHAQQSQPTMEQQLAALQRLEAMQPDSIQPKYQQAVLLLGTVCEQPLSRGPARDPTHRSAAAHQSHRPL